MLKLLMTNMFFLILSLYCLFCLICLTYLYWPKIYYSFTIRFGCYVNGKWINQRVVRERWKKTKKKTYIYAIKFELPFEEQSLVISNSRFTGKWNAQAFKRYLWRNNLIKLDFHWYKSIIKKNQEEKYLDFTLAHELCHLHYDDSKNARKFSKKIIEQKIFHNLCEVRADIVGTRKLQIDVQLAIDSLCFDIKDVFSKSKKLSRHPDDYRRMQYLQNYEEFDERCIKNVIEDLIQDYPKDLKKYDAFELYERLLPFFVITN